MEKIAKIIEKEPQDHRVQCGTIPMVTIPRVPHPPVFGTPSGWGLPPCSLSNPCSEEISPKIQSKQQREAVSSGPVTASPQLRKPFRVHSLPKILCKGFHSPHTLRNPPKHKPLHLNLPQRDLLCRPQLLKSPNLPLKAQRSPSRPSPLHPQSLPQNPSPPHPPQRTSLHPSSNHSPTDTLPQPLPWAEPLGPPSGASPQGSPHTHKRKLMARPGRQG